MLDPQLEQQLWDTFARCVPDQNARHRIALRVITNEARNNPRTTAAMATLASSTDEEIDAAFDRALEHGFPTIDATIPQRPAPRGSLAGIVRGVAGDVEAFIRQVSGLFTSPLIPTPAAAGPSHRQGGVQRGDGDAEGDDRLQAFGFEVPEDITALGVAPRGTAELDRDRHRLNIRIGKELGIQLPPVVVTAVADGAATDPELMTVGASALTATVAWDGADNPSDILLACDTPN